MSGILVAGKIQTLLDRLTAARAAYLDAAISSRASATSLTTVSTNLDTVDTNVDAIKAVTDTLDAPPLTIVGYKATAAATTLGGDLGGTEPQTAVSCGGTQNVYTSVVSVSGNGVITGLGVSCSGTPTQDYQFRFVVDGTTVYTSAANFWSSASSTSDGIALVGPGDTFEGVPEKLRFKTGFSVDVRCTSASSAQNYIGYMLYYTVA
jgi:hypothetical protein